MKYFRLVKDLNIMNKWGLTEAEYLFITVVYPIWSRLGRDGNCSLEDLKALDIYKSYLKGNEEYLKGIIKSLKSKKVLLSASKAPTSISSFNIDTLKFKQDFIDAYMPGDYTLVEEMWNHYPLTGEYGVTEGHNLKSISKNFNCIEDAYECYGRGINWDPEENKRVIDLIEEGKANGYSFPVISRFIVDRGWNFIEEWLSENNKIRIMEMV